MSSDHFYALCLASMLSCYEASRARSWPVHLVHEARVARPPVQTLPSQYVLVLQHLVPRECASDEPGIVPISLLSSENGMYRDTQGLRRLGLGYLLRPLLF